MAERQGAFRVMLRMQIYPGLESQFEETWRAVGDAITEHPANLGQWLSKSADESGVYYVTSDWVDEPQFREFEVSERHKEHRERLHPFRLDGSMTTMHVIYGMTGAGAGDA